MQPQQPSKKTVKAKAKVVAKKPTAQSVAAQRTAMIKKMKGDTAKPAAKKVMPKMADGSGCVSKYPDGSKKVKPTSTAARRASTATETPKKRVGKLSKEELEYNKLQGERKRLPIQKSKILSEAVGKINRGQVSPDFYGQKDKKSAVKAISKAYNLMEEDKDITIRDTQNQLGTRFKKRNATLEKAVSGKMKSGSGCVGKYPDGSKKVKPTAKKTETPKQYAERKAVKPMNITPLGAILVDGTPKGLPSGAVSARQRAAGQQTARQRAEVDKQRANLNAGVDNLERRAAQSKANQDVPITMPSNKNGTERTNTTKGFYSRKSKSEIGTSQGGSARCVKAKGSSGIKTNKYPDGTKKIETKSQYEERKAMKPINLEIQKGPKPQMPDMEAATGKKMKDYVANQQHLGKMGLASLKNRIQPAKPNPNQKYGPTQERTKVVAGFQDGHFYIGKTRKGPKHSLNN